MNKHSFNWWVLLVEDEHEVTISPFPPLHFRKWFMAPWWHSSSHRTNACEKKNGGYVVNGKCLGGRICT
jgi:hypothetical protein